MTDPILYVHKDAQTYHSIGDIAAAICKTQGLKPSDKNWKKAVKSELLKIIQLNTTSVWMLTPKRSENLFEAYSQPRLSDNRILDSNKLGNVPGSTRMYIEGDLSDPDRLELGDKLLLPEYANKIFNAYETPSPFVPRKQTEAPQVSQSQLKSKDWPANPHYAAANTFNFFSGFAGGQPAGIHGSLSYGVNHFYQAVRKENPGPAERTKWVDVGLASSLFSNYAITKLDPAVQKQLNEILASKGAIATFKNGNLI